MDGNKNAVEFDRKSAIPWSDMTNLLYDFKDLGVQGIEVTGGGEPLAYPHTERFWGLLREHGFATALVTNGTLLRDRAPLICSSNLKWARVSIDAVTKETYTAMRRCPESHFELAWRAVRKIREHAPATPDFRLGIGFVQSVENLGQVYEFVRMASESGADNVRLSTVFSDQNLGYFEGHEEELLQAIEDSERAEADFSSDDFVVHNLLPTRVMEIEHPTQDYDRCATKDFLCVVEGSGKVYTCCTFTGSDRGCYGNFMEHPGGFKGLWEENEQWRRDLVARDYCKVACLYRTRNEGLIELMTPRMHKEFF